MGRMFLGGAIPGILIGLALMATVGVIARRANFPVERRATCGELLASTKDAFLALLMPVVVIGGIVTGATTPTEAAMVGVWYAFILGFFVYREIRLEAVPRILVGTAVQSGAVMLTVATATVFGWIATAERLGPTLTQWILSVTNSPAVILLLMMLVLLALGCLMEPIPILVLMTPILFPVAKAVGVDPVHFGVLVTINVTIGMVTPPVGLTLFLLSSLTRESIVDLSRAIAPFLVVLIIALIAITYFPPIVLWLPNLVMGTAR